MLARRLSFHVSGRICHHLPIEGEDPPPPHCLSSAQASRAWERPAWSTATCTTPSARPFRRALACRRASRPQQPAPPRDTRGRRNPVTVTRLSPACHPPATWRTIGASFAMKKVGANGRTCNLGIWDTAGQARLDSSRPRSTLLGLHLTLLWLYSLHYGSTTIAARALLYSGATHSALAPFHSTMAPRTLLWRHALGLHVVAPRGSTSSSSPWLY